MTTPTVAEVLAEAIDARLLDVHTAIPGRVTKYDAAKQVADVEIVVRRATKFSGELALEDYPVIQNVPVAWPRGGGCYVHFPLAEGDHVLLVFSESAIGQWRESGQVSEPGDLARHDLSYPVAIPGVAPNAGKFPDAPTDHAVLIVPDKLRVSNANGGGVEPVALADKVLARLEAIVDAFNAHTHPTGVGPSGPPPSPITPPESVAAQTLEAQ